MSALKSSPPRQPGVWQWKPAIMSSKVLDVLERSHPSPPALAFPIVSKSRPVKRVVSVCTASSGGVPSGAFGTSYCLEEEIKKEEKEREKEREREREREEKEREREREKEKEKEKDRE